MPDIVRKTVTRAGKGRGRNVMGTRSTGRAFKQEADEGSNLPIFAPKMRTCRSCGCQTANYFRCPPCIFNSKQHNATDDTAWNY